MKTAHDILTETGLSRAAEFLQQSDAIESINIPIDAYQSAMLSVFPQPETDDGEGVLTSYVENHIQALAYVLQNHKRLPTIHDCLELHRRLMQNSNLGRGLVGNFRSQGLTWVGNDFAMAAVSVPYAMDNLCFGLLSRCNPLDAHRHFEHIHPFADGNGRTGRLFWAWLRLHNGESFGPFLETAGFRGETFEDKRQAYYADLREFKRTA